VITQEEDMDNQSKAFSRGNRSQHVVASATQYVENVAIFVTDDYPSKGFAFGTAKIDGRSSIVHIPKHGCAEKVEGQWRKLLPANQSVPLCQDEIIARVRLTTEPGKKPSAVLWEVLSQPDWDAEDALLEEHLAEGELGDGESFWDQHARHCDGCWTCNPTAFRPE